MKGISEQTDALFGDTVVTPTELARRVSEITKAALRRPVTIHRAEGDLALMDREKAANFIAAAIAADSLISFVRNFLWILHGRGCPSPDWEWLRLFTPDDVAEFLGEYTSAIADALSGRLDWSAVAGVLHEWQESARALEDRQFLAEVATWRKVAAEEEVSKLTAAELRERLTRAVAGAGDGG